MNTPKRLANRSARLSKRMRRMRLLFEETQVEFAEHFEVYWQTYARWERLGLPRTLHHLEYVDNKLNALAAELDRRNVPAE